MKKNTKENTNAITGREEKTIGVEIEFFGANYQVVLNKLAEKGIQCNYEGYTHQVMNRWKLVTDASVTTLGTGLNKGLELVSPPLKSADMEHQLKLVSEALKEAGAKVDRTCGLHVHHDIEDLNFAQIRNIYKLYTKHTGHIDEMLPESRRTTHQNRWCRPITKGELERLEQMNSIAEIRSMFCDRYKVLNFTAYVKYGTMEFRQHSGTTEFEKIWPWIKITQAIVAQAKAKKNVKPLSETGKKRQSEAFTRDLNLEYTVEGTYSIERKAELRKAAEKRAARNQQATA